MPALGNDVALLKELIAILAWRADYPVEKLKELLAPAKNNLNARKKGELPALEL